MRCFAAVSAFGLAFLLFTSPVFAHEFIQPQSLSDLEHSLHSQQTHYTVPNSEIAFIDIALLRRRFEFIKSWSDAEVREWVLGTYARVSDLQLQLRGVRTNAFDVDRDDTQTWYHPAGYRRAAVAEVLDLENFTPAGIMDLKGSGSSDSEVVELQLRKQIAAEMETDPVTQKRLFDELRTLDHSDGLMSLGEAIAELTRQQAVQKLFDIHNAAHGTSWQTVETYFVLKIPIRILKDKDQWIWAAVLGREGHWRGKSALRPPVGLYNDDFGKFQSTLFDSAIDFGGVVIHDRRLIETFGEPVKLVTYDREDAQLSNAWKFGHETATSPRIEEAVTKHLTTMLKPIMNKWRALPVLSSDERVLRHILQSLGARKDGARKAAAAYYAELPAPLILKSFDEILNGTPDMRAQLDGIIQRILERPEFIGGSLNQQLFLAQARLCTQLLSNR